MTSEESRQTPETQQSEDPRFPRFLASSLDTTELLSSPTLQAVLTLGKRRCRSQEEELSMEPKLQKLRINHEYHDPLFYHFIPKYIAERIPLPFEILGPILNEYLDTIDKQIIKGELNFIDHPHFVDMNRVPIIRKYPNHMFQALTYNFFESPDPNYPF